MLYRAYQWRWQVEFLCKEWTSYAKRHAMERVIAEARRHNQPAYIVVPSDYALAPVTLTEVRPVTLTSNEASLERAAAAIAERLLGLAHR
jgi:TPP-dependent 2-oxoacid decarboxylase